MNQAPMPDAFTAILLARDERNVRHFLAAVERALDALTIEVENGSLSMALDGLQIVGGVVHDYAKRFSAEVPEGSESPEGNDLDPG